MQKRSKYREIEDRSRRSEDITRNSSSRCERTNNDGSLLGPYFPSPLPPRNLYVCVYCGMPCSALYRQLNKNSLSSIKAMHCEWCHRIVDPYVEREWLLVAIDCILLRPEAYRHIFYNNKNLSMYIHIQKDEEYSKQQERGNRNLVAADAISTTSGIQNFAQLVEWTFISSLFHAYLKFKSLGCMRQQSAKRSATVLEIGNSSTLLHAIFVLTSASDLVAQWLALYGFIKLISRDSAQNSTISTNTTKQKYDGNEQKKVSMQPSHSMGYQIYLALLLPTSFHIIVVLVILWENSKTTRAFGSLLVACWQCLGIFLISTNNNSKMSAKNNVLKGCTPLVGIISLIAWRFVADRFVLAIVGTSGNMNLRHLHRTIPCVGYEVDVFGDIISTIANDELGSRLWWAATPVLLCLT
mmetsp:Transcript_13313/g.31347  ORF Transcript_13313/g.31347 Transcript_13313/m.31347 type:complete len:411 (+) Transcript_13313:53-1285(+)